MNNKKIVDNWAKLEAYKTSRNIHRLRLKRKFTLKGLAYNAKIKKSSLKKLETNCLRIRINTFNKVAMALGVELYVLFET